MEIMPKILLESLVAIFTVEAIKYTIINLYARFFLSVWLQVYGIFLGSHRIY
jgi:hypothetical protein